MASVLYVLLLSKLRVFYQNWFLILICIYVKIIYNVMLSDLEELPDKTKWASLVRSLLLDLGFHEA